MSFSDYSGKAIIAKYSVLHCSHGGKYPKLYSTVYPHVKYIEGTLQGHIIDIIIPSYAPYFPLLWEKIVKQPFLHWRDIFFQQRQLIQYFFYNLSFISIISGPKELLPVTCNCLVEKQRV
jgi:hypothetical protein